MPLETTQRDIQVTTERPSSGLLVDVVVLSPDLPLFESIRDAIGERNPVWRARSAEEAVDLLLTGRCGVLLVDMAAVSTQPDTLIQQVIDQFPDVVVCVAGRREDEPLLVPLITDGLVYRFMHKPLSPKRAGMFLQAAIRHHVERRHGVANGRDPLRLVPALPTRHEPLKWLFVAAGVVLFMALLVATLGRHGNPESQPEATPASPSPRPTHVTPSAPRADPVLSRARAAFDAGRYEAPAGRNALDLFEAVLLAHPDNAEAQAGLDRTIDGILAIAGHEATAGHPAEARRLVKRVLDVRPGHAAALSLASRLQPEVPRPAVVDASPPVPPAVPAPMPPAAPAPAPASITANARAATSPTPTTVATVPGVQMPSSVPAPAPGARPVPRVEPDPLTPHYTNTIADTKPPSSAVAVRRNGPRSFGAPISNGLPIAGYVTGNRGDRPTASEAKPAATTAETAPSQTLMPVEEFERLEVKDPIYPSEALRNRTRGWVEMEFTITAAGTVRDIEVVQSEPRGVFEQAAETALGHWRFRPRVVNGQPVAQRSTVILRFDVDG